MKDKIIKFFDNSVTGEIILKRIAFYLFLICVLLVLVFFKLNEINKNLLLVSEPILTSVKMEENESAADVFIEDKDKISDTLPLYEEIEKTSTPESTTQNKTESGTNNIKKEPQTEITTEVLTSNADTSIRINYVINVNSNKIHYDDCTFANRMKEENKKHIQLSYSELNEYLNNGYTLCSTCGG